MLHAIIIRNPLNSLGNYLGPYIVRFVCIPGDLVGWDPAKREASLLEIGFRV